MSARYFSGGGCMEASAEKRLNWKVVVAGLLFLVTVGLALPDIEAGVNLLMLAAASSRAERNTAYLITNGGANALGFLFLIYLVVSGEYHLKNYGTAKSWRLFGISLGLQIALPVAAILLGL